MWRSKKTIKGFCLCNIYPIKIILFAEDAILFSLNEKELEIKLKWLKLFVKDIGLLFNPAKCFSIHPHKGNVKGTIFNKVTPQSPQLTLDMW